MQGWEEKSFCTFFPGLLQVSVVHTRRAVVSKHPQELCTVEGVLPVELPSHVPSHEVGAELRVPDHHQQRLHRVEDAASRQ